MEDLTPIFTGLFLVEPVIDDNIAKFAISKHHITYHYSPGNPEFPNGIQEHDWSYIKHLGIYDDGEILTSHVNIITPISSKSSLKGKQLYTQKNRYDDKGNTIGEQETPLHITWNSKDLPPVASGVRLKKCLRSAESMMQNYWSITKMYETNNKIEKFLENNKMSISKGLDVTSYNERIGWINKALNPIGVWRTFKSKPKDLGV